ncbi:MAG: mitochondrial fission ELM1 family protein [Pseudomonadota bacterium]
MKQLGITSEGALSHEAAAEHRRGPMPRVWLLMGHRAGDNAQVLALAEALGWPFQIKRFVYRKYEFLTNRLIGCTLAGIDRRRSDPLTPPWPDLVITAGRRNEPVARWVQARSGGRTRLIHLGRSWAKPRHFDLIVTTPQYRVPALPNVLQIEAPLHRVTPARLAEAADRWRPALRHLPRPLIAVLIGGDSPPYVFDVEMAERLGRQAAALARAQRGSLLVTTSPRTRAAAAAALRQVIDVPCHFYEWQPDPDSNPYLGYLALADSLIVTGESMSMVAEACATGKPVRIFDMGRGWTRMRAPGDRAKEREPPPALGLAERLEPKRVLHWLLAHGLPARIRRDVRNILRPFVASGRAVWLGDEVASVTAPAPTDLPRTVARVRALFEN